MTFLEYIAQMPPATDATEAKQRTGDARCVDLLFDCCAPQAVQFSAKDWPKVIDRIRAWNRKQWKAARDSDNPVALVLPKKSKPTKKIKE